MARKKFNIEYLALLLGVGSFYLMLALGPNKEVEEYEQEQICIPPQEPVKPTNTIVHDSFSSLLLKDEIKRLDIKFPDIVYGQARLESGNFKSNVFKKYNNLFGFRKSEYLYFRHWKECVAYYANWQKKYYKQGDYFEFLTKIGYAEADSIYKERVLACIK